nr:MAG TPA: hypothetical protein [Crassvirales sp.]
MEKTYVFDTADKGGFDSTALIASLMGNRGVDPNLMALIQNASKNQDAWGGGGMWWIWVIIMFWLWGGNGNMFGRNGMADGIPNQLNNDFGREVLLQAINGNGTALSQLATTLNCDVNALQTAIGQVQSSIQSIANQVGMTGQQIINSIQQGNCQLGNQLAQCCCNIQDSITRTNYENQISNLNQTNTLQNSINFVNSSVERGFAATAYATANQTCELKNAIAAQTQVINDKFCALEMREMARENRDLRDQVQAYQLSASQQAQTANIVNQIRPCPTPAYVVPNPYGCGCNNYGYPFSNSCGCGSC